MEASDLIFQKKRQMRRKTVFKAYHQNITGINGFLQYSAMVADRLQREVGLAQL
jgi:hypothetical protein